MKSKAAPILRSFLLLGVIFFLFSSRAFAQEKIKIKVDTIPVALLIIDEQEFYFPGGKLPLKDPEAAAEKTAEVLKLFREQRLPVIHVQHKGGGEIYPLVKPIAGEKVITKTEANSFNGTDLEQYLKFLGTRRIVICGMQTQMCVEAATRTAYDEGFEVLLVQDACATRDLRWGDRVVSAADVQASTLASMNHIYARVISAGDLE
jgi:nicotinamidase-related amidase